MPCTTFVVVSSQWIMHEIKVHVCPCLNHCGYILCINVVFFNILKHKDSFGKSENLSKIFFAEILVFDHDYEGKSTSSNGLL